MTIIDLITETDRDSSKYQSEKMIDPKTKIKPEQILYPNPRALTSLY